MELLPRIDVVVHALKIVMWKNEVRGQRWKQVAWLNRVIIWCLGIMVDDI